MFELDLLGGWEDSMTNWTIFKIITYFRAQKHAISTLIQITIKQTTDQ